MKKVLVSGVQSSGTLHIGNYFGAIKQNVDLANSGDYESYVFIADYHSMTTLTDSEARRKSIFDTACVYLACGLDVSKANLFKQSDVPQHTELSWILSTVTPVSMLNLAHAYKDKIPTDMNSILSLSDDEGKIAEQINNIQIRTDGEISQVLDGKKFFMLKKQAYNEILELKYEKVNAGLFTYPVLMAADILMYNADIVPVGSDQKQHVEMTREIAGKYNRAYAKNDSEDFSFKMPQAFVKDDVAIVPGLDGIKMSKSKGNVIPLFASDEVLKKAVFEIVTDSARPEDKKISEENNIYKIHSLFLNETEKEILKNKFENASAQHPYGYKQAKDELLESIIRYTSNMRDKYNYYQNNPAEVYSILQAGATQAKLIAEQNIKTIRKQVGLD